MEKSLFERTRSNRWKTFLIFCIFYAVFLLLGLAFGAYLGSFSTGVILAVVVAVIYMLIAMATGESMVLAASGAKPATREKYPLLWNVTEGMAISAGIPMPKLYVIEDSAMNAFATGRDPKHGIICVTTGLMQALNRRELEGVIAHEMSHIKNKDIRVMLYAAVLAGAILLLSDFLLRSFLWGGKGGNDSDNKGAIVFIIIGLALAILSPLIAQLTQLAISRRREYLADADAAILTRYPKGLAGALKKISKDPDPLVDTANKATASLFISTPFRKKKGLVARLWSTHPPIEERIALLERM